jgi:uncharacterized protein with PIN domain
MGFIYIRFYEELNDFLPKIKRKKTLKIEDFGKRTVKDLIQSQGIPHTEVDLILINGESVDFNHHVQAEDYVSVYPVFESFNIEPINKLRSEPLRKTQFMLDVHLGKLAKYLRMLGYDAFYHNNFDDDEVVLSAQLDDRIVLTRDLGMLKRSDVEKGYYIRSTSPKKQLAEVLDRFDLYKSIKPFRICMHCNGKIKPASKEKVEHRLLPDTRKHYTEFFQCSNCKKIYWKGSHHKKMMEFVAELRTGDHVR